ncbi:hypothetical protein [Gracilibacillus salinarum]|uniref:Lipoprotein n=1 Tax=Gracilibacillus salinarum TaxID=2932255 RepID=A0ABY4GJK3_9BACI|nr:hypothetical protein [Gracilibacillus salinarum]UOQ84536.1 hypothetical protein MUN87_17910 [Gracilibacillus salinarum]
MMKKLLVWMCMIIVAAGCSNKSDGATIVVNDEIAYNQTIQDLQLGYMTSFDLQMDDEQNNEITVWVEEYLDGEREHETLMETVLMASESKRSIGMGVLDLSDESKKIILYEKEGSDISSSWTTVKIPVNEEGIKEMDTVVGEEKVEILPGETKILAAYRETAGNAINPLQFEDQALFEKMIADSSFVLVLKMKIEQKEK